MQATISKIRKKIKEINGLLEMLEGKSIEIKKHKPVKDDSALTWAMARFNTAWREYPEKLGRMKAFSHFKAQVKTDEDYANMYIALNNYKAHIAKLRANGHPDRRFQHGCTWFNNHWRDWINPQVESPETAKTQEESKVDARLKEIERKAQEKANANNS